MTNTEIIQAIRKEIISRIDKRRLSEQAKNELVSILSFLSTLESKKPMQEGLEKEIDKYREEHLFDMPAFQQVARHFAEWGAEHVKKDDIPVPADLEEAAWDCVLDNVDVNNPVLLPKYKELLTYLFIAGAKWQNEQMMKEAVETEVVSRVTNKGLLPAVTFLVDESYKEGDKVKVLIVK